MKCTTVLAAVLAVLIPSIALPQNADVRFGGAARFHAGHDKLQDVPYDGDWSYGLVYEYREPQAYFQLLLSYTPNASFTGEFDGKSGPIDSIWTPEFNLLFTQGPWAAGMGILKHHVRREDGGEWSPVMWQFLFGLNLGQRSSTALDVMAGYEFSSWGDVSEIRMGDVDVRISLTRAF